MVEVGAEWNVSGSRDTCVHVGVTRERPEARTLRDPDLGRRHGLFVERDRPLGAQLGEDALAVGPHPLLDVAEVDVVERQVGAGEFDAHAPSLGLGAGSGRGCQLSPTFGMNGGTPLSVLANRVPDTASIDSIVHGLSSVASVIGRQPRTSCT